MSAPYDLNARPSVEDQAQAAIIENAERNSYLVQCAQCLRTAPLKLSTDLGRRSSAVLPKGWKLTRFKGQLPRPACSSLCEDALDPGKKKG